MNNTELVDGLVEQMRHLTQEKQLADFLNGPTCSLFSSDDRPHISLDDVRSLITESGAGLYALPLVQSLNRTHKRTFHSVNDLVEPLQIGYAQVLTDGREEELSKKIRGIIRGEITGTSSNTYESSYSTNPTSPSNHTGPKAKYLLEERARFKMTESDVDWIMRQGGPVGGCYYLLNKFLTEKPEFSSLQALSLALRTAYFELVDKKQELVHLFNSDSSLWHDSVRHSKYTFADADRVMDESGAGGETVEIVRRMMAKNCEFESVTHLVAAVMGYKLMTETVAREQLDSPMTSARKALFGPDGVMKDEIIMPSLIRAATTLAATGSNGSARNGNVTFSAMEEGVASPSNSTARSAHRSRKFLTVSTEEEVKFAQDATIQYLTAEIPSDVRRVAGVKITCVSHDGGKDGEGETWGEIRVYLKTSERRFKYKEEIFRNAPNSLEWQEHTQAYGNEDGVCQAITGGDKLVLTLRSEGATEGIWAKGATLQVSWT